MHCTPVFSSFTVVSMCWHSVSGQQSLCAGAALWGSGGHPASIPTNRGDLGQVRSLSKSGCQVYQTGTNWPDSECSSHDPQDINSLGLSWDSKSPALIWVISSMALVTLTFTVMMLRFMRQYKVRWSTLSSLHFRSGMMDSGCLFSISLHLSSTKLTAWVAGVWWSAPPQHPSRSHHLGGPREA